QQKWHCRSRPLHVVFPSIQEPQCQCQCQRPSFHLAFASGETRMLDVLAAFNLPFSGGRYHNWSHLKKKKTHTIYFL
ncbi:mCG145262, partial [Mus musculus]